VPAARENVGDQVTSGPFRNNLPLLGRGGPRHDLTVSIDDFDLQMRMDAADRADAPIERLIA